jgi:hypothetical protein
MGCQPSPRVTSLPRISMSSYLEWKALVEWLLERHHHRRGRARKPYSQARLQH